ncbi:MAG TPA: gamma-glutamyl-gamma-aminobutyrate hydrolase family protein [Gemmatimonadaceae bacterium]|nr:gamma-glutamyl-gamma-aminobutyrate hydrolase family protein [Gemmatimonadaceae bacterium]
MNTSPVVAITASIREEESPRRLRLNAAYLTAVENAGLVPLIVPPLSDPSAAERILAGVDGLLLTGGEDMAPEYFGQTPHPNLGTVNKQRDATEMALITAARKLRIPLLAICRGIQVLNVECGGSLIQDIGAQRPQALEHDGHGARDEAIHSVAIDDGSIIELATGATRLDVNSLHHQAIDRLGDGLRVTATAPDGIIEGVESTDDWWVLAVQWHPEEMDRSSHPGAEPGPLFKAFAESVRSC